MDEAGAGAHRCHWEVGANVVTLEVVGAQVFVVGENLGLEGGVNSLVGIKEKEFEKMDLPVVGVNILRLGLAAVVIFVGQG